MFPQECGIRKIQTSTRRRSKRVVGGTQSSQGKWPWQAALFYKGSHYCGGAVISNTWILTAGHCFSEYYWQRDENHSSIMVRSYSETTRIIPTEIESKRIIIWRHYQGPTDKRINKHFDSKPSFLILIRKDKKVVSYSDLLILPPLLQLLLTASYYCTFRFFYCLAALASRYCLRILSRIS